MCAIHDICYSTPGPTQHQCDDDFLRTLLTTCSFRSVSSNPADKICADISHFGYKMVQLFGATYRDEDFIATCTEVTHKVSKQ